MPTSTKDLAGAGRAEVVLSLPDPSPNPIFFPILNSCKQMFDLSGQTPLRGPPNPLHLAFPNPALGVITTPVVNIPSNPDTDKGLWREVVTRFIGSKRSEAASNRTSAVTTNGVRTIRADRSACGGQQTIDTRPPRQEEWGHGRNRKVSAPDLLTAAHPRKGLDGSGPVQADLPLTRPLSTGRAEINRCKTHVHKHKGESPWSEKSSRHPPRLASPRAGSSSRWAGRRPPAPRLPRWPFRRSTPPRTTRSGWPRSAAVPEATERWATRFRFPTAGRSSSSPWPTCSRKNWPAPTRP